MERQGLISYLLDGNTYTLSLAERAEGTDRVIRIKREWVLLAKEYRAKNPNKSVDWSAVLKMWLFAIDNKVEVITSKEIGMGLNASPDVIDRAKAALRDLHAIITKDRYRKVGPDTYYRAGQEILASAWLD